MVSIVTGFFDLFRIDLAQAMCYKFNTSFIRGNEGLITVLVPSFMVIALLFLFCETLGTFLQY